MGTHIFMLHKVVRISRYYWRDRLAPRNGHDGSSNLVVHVVLCVSGLVIGIKMAVGLGERVREIKLKTVGGVRWRDV